jgi:Crp-like helix-turn-helix domain
MSRLLAELPPEARTPAAAVLEGCATLELEGGVPYFRSAFAAGALLLVEDGFVVLRASDPASARSVITCEAGAGRLVLPPSSEEVLVAIGAARLTVLNPAARVELMRLPPAAEQIVDKLVVALAHKQDASANLAPTRHVERVRRALLQLADTYGHAVHGGIRIDFPISHSLLAEMIASSRETVTRAIDELQRAGVVERSGSTYRLLGVS